MITLIQLEYLTVLDTYRHFATAAEKCFVTQPTLSIQIKKLEDDLGLIIFDRTRQPLVPTEHGKQIIDQARFVLQEASKIETIASEVKQQVAGELRIGLIPTISPFLLPLFAGHFKKVHPNIDLKVEEAITEHIEGMLEKDMLDLALIAIDLGHVYIVAHHPHIVFFQLPAQ